MSSPSNYYKAVTELEAIKSRAFLLLMSGEIDDIDGPLASALFDMVGDTTIKQSLESIKIYEDLNP